MREPGFWYASPSLASLLLAPIAAIYGAVSGARMVRQGARAAVPVICVGNYHLGGAGKTPTTLRLVEMLRSLGETPFVVSRGYGGSLTGPVRVADHSATEVGDEPKMMARHVPVIVARASAVASALLFTLASEPDAAGNSENMLAALPRPGTSSNSDRP